MFPSLSKISLFEFAESDTDAGGHPAETYCFYGEPFLGAKFPNLKGDVKA